MIEGSSLAATGRKGEGGRELGRESEGGENDGGGWREGGREEGGDLLHAAGSYSANAARSPSRSDVSVTVYQVACLRH